MLTSNYNFKALIFTLFITLSFSSKGQTVVINEVSQGTGNGEYVEFIVTGPKVCAPTIAPTLDLRKWVLDDNNGSFGNKGIATGANRFADNVFWSAIPTGTRILVYNDLDKNSGITAPDDVSMADGNCSLIIPISSNLFETTSISPTPSNPSYPTNNSDWTLGGIWQVIGMRNGGDAFQFFNPSDLVNPVFSISWGDNSGSIIYMGAGSASGTVFSFINSVSDNPAVQANWSSGAVATNQTPGVQNNNDNWDWMASMNSSCRTPLSATSSSIATSCFGLCDGSASAVVSGDVSPYSYNWTNGAVTASASALCLGVQSVTITDFIGCSITESVTITEPLAVSVTSNTIQNETCSGDCDGIVGSSANGGVSPFTYVWSSGASSSSASGLCPNVYTVTATDVNGCPAISSTTVSLGTTVTAALISVTNQCLSGNSFSFDGTASSPPNSCGAGCPSYSWNFGDGNTTSGSSASSNSQINSYLLAGTYIITLTVNNGVCATSSTTTLTVYDEPTVAPTTTPLLCNNNNTGTASAVVSGGKTAYSYLWSTGGNSATISGLAAGAYTLTVTDANNCTTTGVTTVTEPSVISVSVVNTSVTCNGLNTGTATASAQGGSPNYTYFWSNSEGSTASVSGLTAATYTVTATDNNGCTITNSTIITEPAGLLVSITSTSVTCPGGTTGNAVVQATGGQPPYSYLWNDVNNQTTSVASNLTVGTYILTITDQVPCPTITTVTIAGPPLLTITPTITPEICTNGKGIINITVTGANSPYVFDWSNSQNTQNISGLSAGSYSLNITDAKNCTTNLAYSGTVSQITNFTQVTIEVKNTTCDGNDGQINIVSQADGTAPYQYSIDGISFLSNGLFTNLAVNTYTVDIIDANGCKLSENKDVTMPPPIVATATTTKPDCTNSKKGGITVTSSGTGLVTYETNGIVNTTGIFSNLEPGSYLIKIKDENNCTDTITAVILNPCIDYFPPDAFSPNGDGIEDTWLIPELTLNFPNSEILIYDRFGQKVFQQRSYQTPWDGGGRESAAYYYVIYNERGNKKAGIKTGAVSILR